MRLPVIAALALVLPGATAYAAQPDAWVTDGRVHAIVQAGGGTFIGGEFSYVGPANGAGAPLAAATGDPAATPRVEGSIDAVLADGSGGWYVGGAFSTVGGVARANLAHVLANGTVDPAFHPNPNGAVNALARSGSTLYVGGAFATIDGDAQPRAAAVHTTTGARDDAFAPAVGTPVDALAVHGTRVYAGGASGLVAVNAASGAPVSFGGADGRVRALLVQGSTLYLGGTFTHVSGQDRLNAAAFDLTTGDLTTWAPAPDGEVRALAVSGSAVLVGGSFNGIGGQTRNGLAAVGTANGLLTSWNPNPNGSVLALAVSGSTVYAAGSFTSVGGVPRRFLAALSATTGEPTAWRPSADGILDALAIAGTDVYAGGTATSVGGEPRGDLARLSSAWTLDRSWSANVTGTVHALAARGASLYVGGQYSAIGGQTRNGLAAVSTVTGAVSAWNPTAGSATHVAALAADAAAIYAGGTFSQLGGASRSNLAAIDPVSANALDGWDPAPDGTVHALVLGPANVYAGGAFEHVDGQSRDRLAAIDLDSGDAASWNPGADDTVRALALRDGTIYAGGDFEHAGGEERDWLAALDALTGEPSAWTPALNGAVHTIAVLGGNVYAGGDFGTHLAAFAAATGVAATWPATADDTVRAIVATHPSVLVGGDFAQLGGAARHGFGLLDPAPSPTALVTAPSISGAAVAGSTLTAGDGVWGGWPAPAITRVWQRCDGGGGACTDTTATGPTYPLTLADAGQTIRLVVTAANAGGSETEPTPATALVTAVPVSTGQPEVDGTPLIAETLTASDGSWVGLPAPTITRVWQRCDVQGTPASCVDQPQQGTTYLLTIGDVGRTVRVLVTGTNLVGASAAASTTLGPIAAPPSFSASPSIAGTLRIGVTLTAADGFWEGYPVPSLTRSWQRCDAAATPASCLDIGANGSEYVLTQADAGSTLRIVVTAANAAGTLTTASAGTVRVTAPPTFLRDPAIEGRPLVGQPLEAADGEWTGTPAPTAERTWQRCDARGTACKALPTKATIYVPTATDLGKTLRLVVTAVNEAGEAIATSQPTRVVAAPPAPVVVLTLDSRTVKSGTLALRVRCPAKALVPCAPQIVLRTAGAVRATPGGPQRVLTLATLRVRAAPGRVALVTLRLSAPGLRALRAAGSLPLVLTATTTNVAGKTGVARLRFTARG